MNTKLPSLLAALLTTLNYCICQELTIKKGVVVDSIEIKGTPSETFSLFLPENFENQGTWPLLVVLDEKGRGRSALSMFAQAGRGQDYIMAAPNAVHDSLSIAENVKRLGRLFSNLSAMFPLHTNRVYVAGFDAGGRLANIMPIFFKNLSGVVSLGASFNNTDLIDAKNPFHFIGIVGREDFTYPELLNNEHYFNKVKFDNNLLEFNGVKEWPPKLQLSKALHYLTLRSMAKGYVARDSAYIRNVYSSMVNEVQLLKNNKEFLLAERELKEIQNAFRDLMDTDSIENQMRALKKDKLFRSQKRRQSDAFFKESILKGDYQYALDEDVQTYNYNNLGWWNYQMATLQKFVTGDVLEERRMGKRLIGHINAMVDDSIDFYGLQEKEQKDDEALLFLNMLKTITSPEAFDSYLRVISLSAKYEDFGTAIFYLEEVLKKGFSDEAKLYDLPHTALLKITPEFNKIVEKYLKSARYEIKER